MDKVGVEAAFLATGLSRLVVKDIDFLAKDSIRLHTKLAGEYDFCYRGIQDWRGSRCATRLQVAGAQCDTTILCCADIPG